MTGRRLIRRPTRWQAERTEERERQHREAVAAALSATRPPPLTVDEILGWTRETDVLTFTGSADSYVRTAAEARAHAYATATAAAWHDASGALIVAVDELGAVVEVGPGRWPT